MSRSYVGIDVHKKRCVYHELDTRGNVIRRGRFGNNLAEVSEFGSSLTGQEAIVVEPVLNYLWLLDQLAGQVGSIYVATPHKVRVIAEAKCKTDRYDSRILAELLRTNFLPESYIASGAIRELRLLVRRRYWLVQMVVRMKNRIRYLLFLEGVDLKVADVSSEKAIREIKRLYISDWIRGTILELLGIIGEISPRIRELERELEGRSQGIKEIELLRTIPGIGVIWAVTIYAEIGDINRFRSGKAFASYTGLVPIVRSSGESIHLGDITRTGSRALRSALVEATPMVIKRSPSLRRLYARVNYRSNWQKAKVAVARKLAMIIYAMLKNQTPFMAEMA
ncbi:MAG: IS110 family transposase [bacterium]